MSQQTMYSAVNNSPIATLTAAISATDTTILIDSAAKLPPAPNIATIGEDEAAELVYYTAVDAANNMLTNCTRGFNGTLASVWELGDPVYRAYTAYDHNAFKVNIEDLAAEKANNDDLPSPNNILPIESGGTGIAVAAGNGVQGRALISNASVLPSAPTWRVLAQGDIPVLNQNTTGSAAKWRDARRITLEGDASGTGTLDGSADLAIDVTARACNVVTFNLPAGAGATVTLTAPAGHTSGNQTVFIDYADTATKAQVEALSAAKIRHTGSNSAGTSFTYVCDGVALPSAVPMQAVFIKSL